MKLLSSLRLAADTGQHPSEAPVPATLEVHNDGDIEHLRNELARVITKLTGQAQAEAATQ